MPRGKLTLSIDQDKIKILKKKAIDENMTLSDYIVKMSLGVSPKSTPQIKKGNIPF